MTNKKTISSPTQAVKAWSILLTIAFIVIILFGFLILVDQNQTTAAGNIIQILDQEYILKSLENHLDNLQSMFTWALVIAITIAWASLVNKNFEIGGIKATKKSAFTLAGVFFVLINISLTLQFLRVLELLRLVDDIHTRQAITIVLTHTWLFNPFEVLGFTTLARIHGSLGYGLLIICWWICNTSLYLLSDKKLSLKEYIWLGLLLGFGALALITIESIYSTVILLAERINDPSFFKLITSLRTERQVAVIVSAAIGGILFYATQVFRQKSLEESK